MTNTDQARLLRKCVSIHTPIDVLEYMYRTYGVSIVVSGGQIDDVTIS